MKIGDRVTILEPRGKGDSHCFYGRLGTIVSFDETEEFPWEVEVKIDDNPFGSVPFHKTELEVIQ